MQPAKTIAAVFEEFLADEKARVGKSTFSKYERVIGLLESYLESYWPDHDGAEYDRITDAGGTYCGTFGPENIPAALADFLGYFMPRKVIAGRETMKAAGTVTKKLMKWLAQKGYVEDAEALKMGAELAGEAARDLPASQDVLNMLFDYAGMDVSGRYLDKIQDHFTVTQVEPGKIWLEPFVEEPGEIGPVPVPLEVSRRLKIGWDIGGVVVKTAKGWRLLEVWNVSP